MSLNRGLQLLRAGKYFEAHEELEDEWHGAPESERDFLQGLVHVAVAWHHAGLANRPGCERQLDKAAMRLKQYRPHHRGVDVSTLLTDVRNAQWIVESGSLSLPKPRLLGPALKTPVLGQAARRSG